MRNRFAPVDMTPRLADIQQLLLEAQNSPGSLQELPVSKPGFPIYVITCQFDMAVKEPVWAMYEGEDGAKVLWNCPNSNTEMVHDMVCMSIPETASHPSGAYTMPPQAPPPTPAPGPAPAAAMPAYQMPPYVAPQAPQYSTPSPAGEPYIQPDPYAQAAYVQQPQTQPAMYQMPQQTPLPAQAPASELDPYADLMSKGQKAALIGQMLVDAGLVNSASVESAAKLQDRVRLGRMTNQQAVEALKKAQSRGGRLEEDEEPRQPAQAPTGAPRDAAKQVVDLLLQSGLITADDIKVAQGVKSKHGGDTGQILVSAGKIDQVTLDAARQCNTLLQASRLKFEKAVIALHYCQRMRSSLDEAIKELDIDLM